MTGQVILGSFTSFITRLVNLAKLPIIFYNPKTMNSFERQTPETPEEVQFESFDILDQGPLYFGDGQIHTLEVPTSLDVDEELKKYEATRGRISVQNGHILDHKTLSPVAWFLRLGARYPRE